MQVGKLKYPLQDIYATAILLQLKNCMQDVHAWKPYWLQTRVHKTRSWGTEDMTARKPSSTVTFCIFPSIAAAAFSSMEILRLDASPAMSLMCSCGDGRGLSVKHNQESEPGPRRRN